MLYMNYSNCSMELANLVESELGIGFRLSGVQTLESTRRLRSLSL